MSWLGILLLVAVLVFTVVEVIGFVKDLRERRHKKQIETDEKSDSK